MAASGSWSLGSCYYFCFCKQAAGPLHGEIFFCSKDTKAFSEGSDSQQNLVAKGFNLWKQECVIIFPQACPRAMLEEFKLPASPQHLATGDSFGEEITQPSRKAVIISHWAHFMQHLLLLLGSWTEERPFPPGTIRQCLWTFLICKPSGGRGL